MEIAGKNKLLHLYFDDILVDGILFLPPAPFFRAKLTRTKRLIDCGLSFVTTFCWIL